MTEWNMNGVHEWKAPKPESEVREIRPNLQQRINDLDNDLDVLTDEIVKLQYRINALERLQGKPDGAFWGQLLFDVMAVIVLIVFMAWR